MMSPQTKVRKMRPVEGDPTRTAQARRLDIERRRQRHAKYGRAA